MKIVMIHGQNHKGSTWKVAQILLENIVAEKDVKEYFLPKDMNHFCLGCYSCLKKREACPFWNEKEIIMNDILDADLLILTSPNYCMMPSAPMKAFFDLFYTNWGSHKPYSEMFKKRAVAISTTAGAGAKKTTKLMAENLRNWCIPKIYEYGIAVNAMNWNMVPEKKKQKIQSAMTKLGTKISIAKPVRVGFLSKIRFMFYRGMQKANWGAAPEEKQYWAEKGWLEGKKPWNEI